MYFCSKIVMDFTKSFLDIINIKDEHIDVNNGDIQCLKNVFSKPLSIELQSLLNLCDLKSGFNID